VEYLDEAEHLLHNRKASVASLRSVFGIIPECRSASSGMAFTFSGIRRRQDAMPAASAREETYAWWFHAREHADAHSAAQFSKAE
jgi:hypothetical protein